MAIFEYYNRYTKESKTMEEITAIISKRNVNSDFEGSLFSEGVNLVTRCPPAVQTCNK